MRNQKIILVDAYNCLFIENGIDKKILEMLESFQNRKIVLTNADDGQMVEFGIDQSPYEVFTLKHNPNKTDGGYYEDFLNQHSLKPESCIYFEHNEAAVEKARDLGIKTYHYKHDSPDYADLMKFIEDNIK